MPRGRRKKPVNYEEEIAVFDMQIAELTKKLSNVKEKKKARMKKEDENKDADKWDKIKNSGFSVDELLDMVNKNKD